MKLIFVDIYKKDRIIATVQSDIIPTSSRGASMDVILEGKKSRSKCKRYFGRYFRFYHTKRAKELRGCRQYL